jgi:bifunctional DNase/RNase
MKMLLAAALLLFASSPWPLGQNGSPAAGQEPRGPDLVAVELFTVGADPRSGAPVVLLREPKSGDVVPIWVGEPEARAIALALHGVAVPRPMTHDLMASLLSELRGTVVEVLVHSMVESTYIGTVRLRLPGDGGVRDIDSRPSDALALALRSDAPIRVARQILVGSPDFDFVAPDGADQIVQLLGMTVVAPSPALRRQYALDDRAGGLITRVTARAQARGVAPGDLIVEVNGRPVRQPMDFFEGVRATPATSPVRLLVVRAGKTHEIELPSIGAPAEPGPSEERFKV